MDDNPAHDTTTARTTPPITSICGHDTTTARTTPPITSICGHHAHLLFRKQLHIHLQSSTATAEGGGGGDARENPRPSASSGTIPTCGDPGRIPNLIHIGGRRAPFGSRRPDIPIFSDLRVPMARRQKTPPTGYTALYRLRCPRVLAGPRRCCPRIFARRDHAGRCRCSARFSRGSPVSPRICVPALLHTYHVSPSPALKTSMLGSPVADDRPIMEALKYKVVSDGSVLYARHACLVSERPQGACLDARGGASRSNEAMTGGAVVREFRDSFPRLAILIWVSHGFPKLLQFKMGMDSISTLIVSNDHAIYVTFKGRDYLKRPWQVAKRVSHPLVHSRPEHLSRRHPSITSRRLHFTSLTHTRQAASIKDCRPLGCGSIHSVLGRHLESSPTRVMRRGGLRRQPVSPEHSCIVAKRIGNSSRREQVCDASKSRRCRHSRDSQKEWNREAASASFQEEGRREKPETFSPSSTLYDQPYSRSDYGNRRRMSTTARKDMSGLPLAPPPRVSHPLVHSNHEHLSRHRPAISSRRPLFTSLAHTCQTASVKDCRPLDCGSIYGVLGHRLESSPTRMMRRGGPRRQPVSPEHSCVGAKLIGNSSMREEVCGASKSRHCRHSRDSQEEWNQEAASVSFQEEERVLGVRLRRGAAESAPATAMNGRTPLFATGSEKILKASLKSPTVWLGSPRTVSMSRPRNGEWQPQDSSLSGNSQSFPASVIMEEVPLVSGRLVAEPNVLKTNLCQLYSHRRAALLVEYQSHWTH
ncbi:hypothetical protein PR048_004446 [Dryococelus australis]|uniref:Uncharacterized protein n=1 Tax=Dryococelus australis TaxID=614101 RepID=A0ABQ9I5H3_9NEOP|nr:hypothetical protein PR048_004446 [Dryococelus australis]